jgi:alanyl-tRNA synthetase
MSTERLYYNDPFLYEFHASVLDTKELKRQGNHSTWAVKLDRSAFYPTSGGQPHDLGIISTESKSGVALKADVEDVFEDDDGDVWHRVSKVLPLGAEIRGSIDAQRRRAHMQQHTGQHLLSAAFIELLNAKTLSFHLGEQISTIDIDAASLSREDLVRVEQRANEVIAEDRPITIRYATREQAAEMGVRKLPERAGEIRLIEIQDFDLNACGGTHARSTGQIGGLLLRRTEKVKQGMRVEFVCGLRAVAVARSDYELLTDAASLYPCAATDLPSNISKQREELRAAAKRESKLLEELAELKAEEMLRAAADENGPKILIQIFDDRDAAFIKLLAQKLTRSSSGAIALLASSQPAPALVFARSSDLAMDVGALLRELVTPHGGRGGGSKDFAQGGVPSASNLADVLQNATERVRSSPVAAERS